ncbi:non-specific serine/threonine protein kinase [Ranunculus cassubicifolius]
MSDGINISYDLSMAIACAFLLLLIIVLFIVCRKKPSKPQESIQVRLSAQPWPLSDVHAATDGFNPRRIIGKGQLGIVYVAISTNGAAIAVKRINPGLVLSNAGFGFSSIMKSLSLANHPNIVPIVGFSEAPGERIILMQFMGMNSLEFYLHQSSSIGASTLDWSARIRIAAGAARGIEYLHQSMNPSIVHGCIKPSNILVDVNFSAKVCDYGMSYLGLQERRCLVGYTDGENGGACKENDVYGFGVVLLELLSGRLCEGGLLVDWALPLIRNMGVVELLDPRLILPVDVKPLFRLAKLASACIGNSRHNRPSMVQVTTILNNLEMQL